MKIDLDDGMPPNLSRSLLPESGKKIEILEKAKSAEKLEKALSLESCVSVPTEKCSYDEATYGDAVFSMFLVSPQVVSVWRGTWGIMELHPELFPYAQIYLLGIVIHICFALLRAKLLERSAGAYSSPGGGPFSWITERILSRVYTYIFILCNIMHWRGGFGLFDLFISTVVPEASDPHRPVLILAVTLTFYVAAAFLRSSRNFLASPYFLVTDGKEATYIFTTRFRVSAAGYAQKIQVLGRVAQASHHGRSFNGVMPWGFKKSSPNSRCIVVYHIITKHQYKSAINKK
ncbi:unnamed protein product [Arctia plantaginis]|uniref:Uncharacterized protein n=1 Tax=Arctia plantaginis TaxID=874455 RepID=A0A8S0YWW7_ARCPL|nr:unnamed protein product [Arctia plantaginis]